MTNRSRKKKLLRKIVVMTVLVPVVLFSILLGVVYVKQDSIIQSQIDALNHDHKGLVEVGDTHLSPFQEFPYISIKVDNVRVLETKEADSPVILDLVDIYAGFMLWDILKGNYDVQTLIVEDGFFNLILHEDGTTNIQNALATEDDVEESEPLNVHLKHITLNNVDFHKLNESTDTDVETYIFNAEGGFKSDEGIINAHIDTEFELNVMQDGDTTYINHKHFDFHTDATFDEASQILSFEPSGITMEHADFLMEGTVDTKGDVNVDLSIKGTKPNFDMLIAFAPHDVVPVLERYKNAGKIYFNVEVQGPVANGFTPFFNAQFGASEAFLENVHQGTRVDDMGFQGHFTNGEARHLTTTEFSLTGMTARLEKGNILGSVVVRNFEEPEVDMQIKADFDLEFLASFFELEDIQRAAGKAVVDMRFHDVVDLDHPEKALSQVNQAYFMEILVDDLELESGALPAPLEHLDLHLIMDGKRADLDKFDMQLGGSDLSMTGYFSDLPAVLHHTDIPVEAHLEIESKTFDIAELTQFSAEDSTGVDERIEDLIMGFSFASTARNFTESEHLPEGEFFIDNLHAQLKHYPHELHDFHADILIDEVDLKIVDFTGEIDQSDFHFNGAVHDYGFWFQPELQGDVDLDLTLGCDLFRLENVFSYNGENYVPEDYRHEEFEKLAIHVNTSMHYRDSQLHSIDIDLDKLEAKMHAHPMRFENFNGRLHYEDDHIVIEDLHGKMGRTIFDLDMNYYLGEDEEIKKRMNHLGLHANYIDFDQLFAFDFDRTGEETLVEDEPANKSEHAEAFNIYELPFTDMTIDVDISHFMFHQIDLQDIHTRLRTTHEHYLYVDTLRLTAAEGSFNMSGYFNGSDPKHIYLKPNLSVKNADIDKLLFKFESLGQDMVLTENLHGLLSAEIQGHIRMYPDMVPNLDESEIHLDVEILNGRLVNYEPMLLLSDYMGDKDLTDIRFDTLSNHMDLTRGLLSIPRMNIESTLGHYEISGSQDLDNNLDYYIRIPWKTIRESAKNKLFGGKEQAEDEPDDEIVELDPNEKKRYLNLRIHGTLDDYKIKLGKKRK